MPVASLKAAARSERRAAVGSVFIVAANDVVIADLTLGYCRHHGIQVRGEHPYDVSGLRVHNCRLVNCNQQFIKGSSSETDPVGATEGCIEQCLFEFTSGWAYQSYTGGIDIHKGVNWTVRDNLFDGERVSPPGPGNAWRTDGGVKKTARNLPATA